MTYPFQMTVFAQIVPYGATTSIPVNIILFITVLACYMIPTLIAMARKKKNAGAILALNFLLGWSILGWIAALVWALAREK